MGVESEICAYIRNRKDKEQAILMACSMYSLKHPAIVQMLQHEGLMDLDGKYIEPMRLTGKEQTMAKKINYPSYQWSPERKQKLSELYQQGVSPGDIAVQLGTTTDIVYDAISKFNITLTKQVQPAAPVIPPPESEKPAAVAECPGLLISMEELSDIRRYVIHTQELVRDASKMFLDDRCYEAFQAIGKQEILLQNVQQILRKVFPVT